MYLFLHIIVVCMFLSQISFALPYHIKSIALIYPLLPYTSLATRKYIPVVSVCQLQILSTEVINNWAGGYMSLGGRCPTAEMFFRYKLM